MQISGRAFLEWLYNVTSNENKGKRHEDFNEFSNPFDENRLVVLDTGDIMNSDAEACFANLLERNEERYKEFYKHRLVICDIPITDTIKTYKLD